MVVSLGVIATGVTHVMRCKIRSNVVTAAGIVIGLAPIRLGLG